MDPQDHVTLCVPYDCIWVFSKAIREFGYFLLRVLCGGGLF